MVAHVYITYVDYAPLAVLAGGGLPHASVSQDERPVACPSSADMVVRKNKKKGILYIVATRHLAVLHYAVSLPMML